MSLIISLPVFAGGSNMNESDVTLGYLIPSIGTDWASVVVGGLLQSAIVTSTF